MAAFQFPDPAVQTTVTNPITGSTYQWKEPPGKWVVTVTMRNTGSIIWEGDNPPDPIGDYKLWYSTDTLELYFHYCDAAGTCAWVPTSTPITMLEDLDNTVFELGQLLNQVNMAASTNENDIQTIKDSLGQVDLQEVLDNGNVADKGAEFGGTTKIKAKGTTSDGNPLFVIEGDQANSGTGDNLLVARRHRTQGDQIRYYGPVTFDKEIATKEYVDAADAALDLEQVLTNGNVADHAIELTDGSDDLIIISPEQAVVGIASDLSTKNPRFRLAHVDAQGYPDAHAQWEIDNNGTRSDLELSGDIEGFHVRFDDTEKLLLDNQGNVELKGGIKTKGDVDLKIGTGETITIDSGSSYEPMLHLKSYSSTTTFGVEDPINPEPRARKDVFIVNARGNAELLGNLSLAPGTQNQHAVTYSQLVEVEEEIESIVPSLERGQWDIHLSDLTSSDEGKFNLLRPFSQADAAAMQAACDAELEACIRNPNIDQIDCESDHDRCERRIPAVGTGAYPTDDFASVESIKFSAKDVSGVNHTWSDVKPGMMIDVFNQDDDSYVLAEILSVVGTGIVTFNVKVIQYKGKATGRCRIKIFELDLDAGTSTDFVRKTGDTMTGRLMLKQTSSGNDVLQVKDTNDSKIFIVGSDNNTLGKVVVQANKEFKIGTQQKQNFKIYSDSTCILSSLRDPNNDTDAVNRRYMDEAIEQALARPAHYRWKVKLGSTAGEPNDGEMLMANASFEKSKQIKFSRVTGNGSTFYKRQNRLIFEGKFISGERVNTQVITFWEHLSNGEWRWKGSADVHYMQWDGYGHVLLNFGEEVHGYDLDEGLDLYVTIAGFF